MRTFSACCTPSARLDSALTHSLTTAMAAPDYVPTPLEPVRTYSSPPRRPGSWMANRPGDLHGRQPEGPQLGSPGPDQGFALTIAEGFRYRLSLSEGEHAGDALAGAAAVGNAPPCMAVPRPFTM
jgi:hypothetical protein